MKNKSLIISIVLVIVLIIVFMVWFLTKGKPSNEAEPEDPKSVVSTVTEKYMAYIKINPSIKLNYSYTCDVLKDGTRQCSDPIVNDYELVNADAKEIFKDVDLLANTKELSKVIDYICEKVEESGIEVINVDIQSDWDGLNNYLKEENENQSTKEEIVEKSYSIEVNVEKEEVITNNITTDEKIEEEKIKAEEEAKIKAEEEARIKAEEEAKAKAEAEAKAKAEAEEKARQRAAQTIYLNDGVTYCHGMTTYECDNCFSTSLINTLKKAKGHSVVEATSSSITIKRMTSLSGKYNSTTYFGTGLLSKITEAGGEEVGGAGGCEDEVTKAVCSEFNLICE